MSGAREQPQQRAGGQANQNSTVSGAREQPPQRAGGQANQNSTVSDTREPRQAGGRSDEPSAAGPTREVQEVLAAHHAAIYGYGVVGAHLGDEQRGSARQASNAHRRARDRLRELLRDAGATPSPAAAGYALPQRVSDADSAVRLAVLLEERVAGAYTELVAAADAELREFAARRLRECALRAARWRGSTVAFPGLGRPANRPG